MNKRIRKKKDKQRLAWAINGLVALYEEQQRQKEAAIEQKPQHYIRKGQL